MYLYILDTFDDRMMRVLKACILFFVSAGEGIDTIVYFPYFLVFWRHFAGSTDGFLVVGTQTRGFSWRAKTSDDHTLPTTHAYHQYLHQPIFFWK